MMVADPLTLNMLCNAILNNNREIKNHIICASLLLLPKISSFTPVLSIRIVRDSLYLLTFSSEKFST